MTARHAFVVYKLMATLFGATTVEVDDPHFAHDLDAMAAAITPKTKEVFIANPNNPTGTLLSQAEIDRFMDKVPDHVIVVFDEAYHEFLENPPDTLKFVREGRNVVVLRTFSKIQGLANLRIGYGLAKPELIDVLQKTRQPFNVNGIAQAGALAGLLDDEHQRKTREITIEGREYLQREFAALGLEFVPSFANFVLVKVGDGKTVFQTLMKRGIIVRDMTSYGLPEWIRVSIGTMEQNIRFPLRSAAPARAADAFPRAGGGLSRSNIFAEAISRRLDRGRDSPGRVRRSPQRGELAAPVDNRRRALCPRGGGEECDREWRALIFRTLRSPATRMRVDFGSGRPLIARR
ncbi:MAG: histidinol-phosphate transaminase [Chthoniobacter sp.]